MKTLQLPLYRHTIALHSHWRAIYDPGSIRTGQRQPQELHRMARALGPLSPRFDSAINSKRGKMPNHEESWNLLCEYTQSESLRKHALAVEACVRAYARKLNA